MAASSRAPARTLRLPLLGLAILVMPLAAPRAQDDGVEAKVASLLKQADSGDLDGVWQVGRRISALNGAKSQGEALTRAIAQGAAKAGPLGRLAAARALIEIAEDESLGRDVLEALTPVVKGEDLPARVAAVSLLGSEDIFNRKVLPQVQTLLEENATSELVDPAVRVEAAKALWRQGTEAQRRGARDVLRQFLASTDQRLKVAGALALADINTDSTEPAWDVLRQIQHEPTPEGRLAASHLRLARHKREFESLLRNLTQQSEGRSNATGSSDQFAVLKEIMRTIHLRHLQGDKVDDEFLITHAAKGMMDALDRHTSFFTSDEYQRFFFDLNREYGGIGAFVNFDREDIFSIVRPIYSGPAYRAGLRSGDKIIEVDGWETQGHTSDEIIARLKGKPETPVTIKVYRPGWTEPQAFTITREEIRVPAVSYELLPGNVGYVELVTFASSVTDEMRNALIDLQKKGAKMIVLDVRNNTGGYLEEARDIVELFVPGEQLVVYTQGRDEPRVEFRTRDRAVCDLPVAVLVNDFSASASEIVAGALQDLKRGVVVGKRTYGKGSVQSLIPVRAQPGEPFEDKNQDRKHDEWEPYTDLNGNKKYDVGPRLKLTVARYHLPSGRSPNKELDTEGKVTNPDWGVIPDHEADVRELAPEDAWKNAELIPLVRKDVFNKYVKERLAQHKDLFLQLAFGDSGDPSRYPDFDQFYEGLQTKLSKDDVRRWLRYAVRDAVSDVRGKAFPGQRALGDHQEDGQLQEAVRVMLKTMGKDIGELKEYQGVLKPVAVEKEKTPARK